MSAPVATRRVKKALLAVVAADELHRKADRELYAVQAQVNAAYKAVSELREKAIELWKKDCQPNGPTYGHILLPDGRLACLQEGSITIWDLTKL